MTDSDADPDVAFAQLGERRFHRLFELAVAASTVAYVVAWAFYLERVTGVVLPLGLAQYVDISFLFGRGGMVNAAAIAIALAVALVRGSGHAYLVALVLVHHQYAARFCLGEISHGSNVIGLALLCIGLGRAAFRDPIEGQRFALTAIRFLVGFGYLLAATCKLIATGTGWVDGRHLWLWLAERATDVLSQTGRHQPGLVARLAGDHLALATALLSAGLLAELSAVGLWWRRTRAVSATALILFHVGIGLTMQLWFQANLLILAAIGYPWPTLLGARRRLVSAAPSHELP